ncbi:MULTISPECIES: FG-GAP and VCBS repeat-containing protein [Sorangium]|uniref:FG-GAP and VCBS repeat-containing protein n=1 Tax=Sorangium TaxID=39643 RepID=UPI0013EA1332|nr:MULTISPECIES: FG-GAP and VCBS repeat-containing protein [Sorangium]
MATADVNGDGFADAVIAGTSFANERGMVRVLSGSSAEPETWSPSQDFWGSLPGNERSFGHALASGDINGDGYADLVVGAPGDGPDLFSEPGSAYVVSRRPRELRYGR